MVPRSIVVLPRLFLGVIFAVAVFGKLSHAAAFPMMLGGFLSQMSPSAQPFYQSFVHAVVLPNLQTFATLVIAGELFVAISMLLGLATRLGALVAVLLLLNYMLAKGTTLWTPSSNDAADIILAIVAGAGAAGRTLGVDRFLEQKWPAIPIW